MFFIKDNFTSHSSPVITVTISWQTSTCCLSCSFFNDILNSKVRIRANSCISNKLAHTQVYVCNPAFFLWQTCIILTNLSQTCDVRWNGSIFFLYPSFGCPLMAADNGLFQYLMLLFPFSVSYTVICCCSSSDTGVTRIQVQGPQLIRTNVTHLGSHTHTHQEAICSIPERVS